MCSSDSVYYCLSLPHLQNQRVIKREKNPCVWKVVVALEQMQIGAKQKYCLETVRIFVIIVIIIIILITVIIIIIEFQRAP